MLYATFAYAALPGCAAQLQGIVRTEGVGTRLEAPDGHTYRLVLGPETDDLAKLDGELVQVTGQHGLGTLRVATFRVSEGPHGMSAWLGVLRPLGSQLGLDDRNSGAFYLIDQDSVDAMWDARGHLALIEGYVNGPNVVHVTWWQDLDAPPPASR